MSDTEEAPETKPLADDTKCGVAIAAYYEARKIVDYILWNAPLLRCPCNPNVDNRIVCHETECPIAVAMDGRYKIDELLKR